MRYPCRFWFSINFPQRLRKRDLLSLLTEYGGLALNRIGVIELNAGRATIEVPGTWSERLAKTLDGSLLLGKRIVAWAESNAASSNGGQSQDSLDHLRRLIELGEFERQAEAERAVELGRRRSSSESERLGHALVDLTIVDEETGLGGRTLLRFVKRSRSPLPWTRLSNGSPIVLTGMQQPDDAVRGVVSEIGENTITIAIASLPESMEEIEYWRIDHSNDEISSQRQRAALERAIRAKNDRLAQLRDVLLGETPARYESPLEEAALDAGLNTVQCAAVEFALAAQDVALIHGPPGTGKTTTLVELIRRSVRRGERILVCGPSNMAVDNLLERLLRANEPAIRLGHPARVMPLLRSHTLEMCIERHPDVKVARKLVKDAMALFKRAARFTRAKPEPDTRRQLRAEAKALLADARRIEAQAVEHLLDTTPILCATTTGLDDSVLGNRRFDLVVIDEACQSTEPGCWIAVTRGRRVVLAGDHRQLPPTVLSDEAKKQGYDRSLFERLAETKPEILKRLAIQYRMHSSIMEFSSLEFYDADLIADSSVAAHLASDLTGVIESENTKSPLEFIDTAGAGYDEETEVVGQSRMNRQEAELVVKEVNVLIKSGISPQAIGIITPYAAQVRLLREKLPDADLEIDTVDGFQGREKEVIVISFVRSNDVNEIGFLGDLRRTNVAMTRARRKLLMIGDSATLAGDPFYARLIEYVQTYGRYCSVWET
ncbi:MAG: AAA domain-containing protein [Pirellulales bacterium]